MTIRPIVGLVAAFTIVAGASALPAAAQGGDEAPRATEVGVTPDEIRIAVVADDENPLAPGLFHGSPVAVKAFAKYINSQGGLAKRKVVVDFIDSHLSADDARNAIIKACSEDFAIVGTAALFLNNMDDAIACQDKAGAATGIPDLAIVTTEVSQQCSPVTFGINPPQLDCKTKDAHPQTFRANQGSVKYYQRTINKKLHGAFVYSNDLKQRRRSAASAWRAASSGGREVRRRDRDLGSGAAIGVHAGRAADEGRESNYAMNSGPFSAMVALRKEAKLQGVNLDDIVWDCFSNCYDKRFIEQAGADAEGQYVTLTQLPFNEGKSNKASRQLHQVRRRRQRRRLRNLRMARRPALRDSVNAIVNGMA